MVAALIKTPMVRISGCLLSLLPCSMSVLCALHIGSRRDGQQKSICVCVLQGMESNPCMSTVKSTEAARGVVDFAVA